MDDRYIALAIPVFFALISLELGLNARRGDTKYRLHDTIASLSAGVGQLVFGLALGVVALAAYAWIQARFGRLRIAPDSPLAWGVLVLAVDLCYYATHRANHRVNLLWAGHAVHHQSEEYNLSTALRQSWLEPLLAAPFYWPLALLGFPVEMFVTVSTANTLYQFWIHTRSIKTLGPLEWVLNTPSSHRVHHGIDPRYIDKNYAGMFIVWDRLFGTYVAEDVEPTYGTVKPLGSYNPLWANVVEWVRLGEMARSTAKIGNKMAVFWSPPEWRPADLGGPVVVPELDRARYRKYDVVAPPHASAYVVAQFATIAIAITALLWFHGSMTPLAVAASGFVILAALVAWGALIEGRRWARPLEIARLALSVAVALWVLPSASAVAIAAIAFGSAMWLAAIPRAEPSASAG